MKFNEKPERKPVARRQDSIPIPWTGIICKIFSRDYLFNPTWLTGHHHQFSQQVEPVSPWTAHTVFHPARGSGMTLTVTLTVTLTWHLLTWPIKKNNRPPTPPPRDISRNTSYQACSKWIMKVERQRIPPYTSFKNSLLVHWYSILLQTCLVFCKRKSHAQLSQHSWHSKTHRVVASGWTRRALFCMFLKWKQSSFMSHTL